MKDKLPGEIKPNGWRKAGSGSQHPLQP